MSGIKNLTLEELRRKKFDVIQHFGMNKKGKFFIMNTIEPREYGADCRDYTWFEIHIENEELLTFAEFIHDLFGMVIDVTSIKKAVSSIDDLENKLKGKAPKVDWGACTVTKIPFNSKFKNIYVEI